MKTILIFILLFFSVLAQAGPSHLDIARKYAPIVIQRTSISPKADAITRFDFDGDWNGNNNWASLRKYGTPAFVYYEVIESQRHYFVTYSFFHPRDYATKTCFWSFCHENDLEGFMVVLEKGKEQFGSIVHIESMAHDKFHLTKNPIKLDPFSLQPIGDDQRVVIDIEAGGHGAYPWDGKWPKTNKALIYTYTGHAEDPEGASAGRYGYELLPTRMFWDRRHEVGVDKVFWAQTLHIGRRTILGMVPAGFAGQKWGRGLANPPWGWHSRSEPELPTGDWFFDPAWAAFRHDPSELRKLTTPNTDYVHNPYLGIEAQ